MSKYGDALPQLSRDLFITDGGIETTLIYQEGLELPSFASFILLNKEEGRQALRKYFSTYAALAKKHQVGLILESATWRASPEWAEKLGYAPDALAEINHQAIDLLQGIRKEHENPKSPIVISGCIGPRGDGYKADRQMSAEDAETYHEEQIRTFKKADVDMISAITMTYPEEAIGIVWAARSVDLPVVISFTVETDGRLPNGYTLEEAIEEVDEATDGAPAYYMVNCAHPTHLQDVVDPQAAWAKRVRGIRVNASKLSHAELDQATALDAGDPAELAAQCAQLKKKWPALNVLGGCCGTDHRHIEEICKANLS
jgi:S-methylmethionine-dependent homocysteine/selenocysteine methylase